MKFSKPAYHLSAFLMLVTALLITALLWFNINLQANLKQSAHNILTEASGQQLTAIKSQITAEPDLMETITEAISNKTYNLEYLSDVFELSSFNGNGYSCIIDINGQIILMEDVPFFNINNNIFTSFLQCDFSHGYTLNDLKENIVYNHSGTIEYTYNGDMFLAAYQPFNIGGCSFLSIVPINSISELSNQIQRIVNILTGIIIVLFAALSAYTIFSSHSYRKELSRIAYVDNLTGASNKKKFKLDARRLLDANHCQYAFVLMDIDKFKVLNDSLGYDFGDDLLICIKDIIIKDLDNDEAFGRGDSDNFYMLLKYTDDESITKRIKDIILNINTKFKGRTDNSYSLVLCVGIYAVTDPTESVNLINDKAKHAHQLVKGSQESSISFYSEEIRLRILKEKEIENKMHHALVNNEFILYLQPKYLLNNEKICGCEALVRWLPENSEMLYPNDFIPVFEKNGFVTKLDMYMLHKACEVIKDWIEHDIAPLSISINFSRVHLQNEHFVDDIAKIVAMYKIPSQFIEIELTESTMLHNENVLIDVLSSLHSHGFTLSMDDFGSGYSSLGLLKNLPVDTVKLDRTFFTQYNDLARAKTVISNMLLMAKQLGIFTVAEGVETKDHIDLLTELGCDIVQGYYYAKPMTVSDLNKLLLAERQSS